MKYMQKELTVIESELSSQAMDHTHQRCVGDMVTKKTRFFWGSTLEATQSAQAPIANSIAPNPSNSSQAPFSSALHLQTSQSLIIAPFYNQFYNCITTRVF
jgi:hypothetical protein